MLKISTICFLDPSTSDPDSSLDQLRIKFAISPQLVGHIRGPFQQGKRQAFSHERERNSI